jgi:hypothetical protein
MTGAAAGLLMVVLAAHGTAVEVPSWVLRGIARVETRSRVIAGRFVYVDQRVGSSGERGPWQMTRRTFRSIGGKDFDRLQTDIPFARKMAARYLLKLYRGPARGSWGRAVAMYNTGPRGYAQHPRQAACYYQRVLALSRKVHF